MSADAKCPGCGESARLSTYKARHIDAPEVVQTVTWCAECAHVACAPEGSMGAQGCGEWTFVALEIPANVDWRAELDALQQYVGGADLPPTHPAGRAALLLGRSEYRGEGNR